jgi:hypothetical protein
MSFPVIRADGSDGHQLNDLAKNSLALDVSWAISAGHWQGQAESYRARVSAIFCLMRQPLARVIDTRTGSRTHAEYPADPVNVRVNGERRC